MRKNDVVIFKQNHEYAGYIGYIKNITNTNINVHIFAPPNLVLKVECKECDLINLKREYPFEVQLEGSE